jgi:hypothetical protein
MKGGILPFARFEREGNFYSRQGARSKDCFLHVNNFIVLWWKAVLIGICFFIAQEQSQLVQLSLCAMSSVCLHSLRGSWRYFRIQRRAQWFKG